MTIAQIKTDIENRILELDPSFKKLSHVFTFTSNKFEAHNKRFSVLPSRIIETRTITNAVTFVQTFQVFLTKGFRSEHLSDSSAVDCITSLQEFAAEIIASGFKDRFKNYDIINVNDAKMSEGNIEHQYNIALLDFEFTVTHRKKLGD